MTILYILLALLIFGILIFIHELGHFLVARCCGVKILEFAIGMGPKLLSWKSKKSGTAYALRLFPIGGFVNMLGENGMEAVQGANGEEGEAYEETSLINHTADVIAPVEQRENALEELEEAPIPLDPELAKQAYCNQNVWKRILISIAGPLMNILLGFLLMLVMVLISGHDQALTNQVGGFFIVYENEAEKQGFRVNDYFYGIAEGESIKRILSYKDLETVVRESETKRFDVIVLRQTEDGMDSEYVTLKGVTMDEAFLKSFTPSVSNSTGLERNDTVIKVNSTRVHTYNELAYEVMNQGYKPMTLTVLRNGQEHVIENVLVPTQTEGGATLGAVDFIPYREPTFDFLTVIKHTWFRSLSTVKMVFDSIVGLFSGRYGVETVSGPVGITKVVGEAAQYGFTTVLNIVVVISINLGVMNLLPLPALDGGHILIYLVEAVRRKPLKKEVEGMINFIGLVLLLSLAVIVAFKDIFTLF